ncbi:hypothetical protein ACFL02_08710 [Planctomycetota bacterium]
MSYINLLKLENFDVDDFTLLEIKPAAGLNASATIDDPTTYSVQGGGNDASPGVHFVFEYVARESGAKSVGIWELGMVLPMDSIQIMVRDPQPAGTEFTYQGRLMEEGTAVSGLRDLQFKVYRSLNALVPYGIVTKEDVGIYEGYFTVQLDFGSDIFNGENRWMQIGVRPGELADPNEYTVLAPRQELTPSPYAIYARKAGELDGGVGITGNGAANYIPKFLDASTLGNSIIYESDSKIGIGTDTPSGKLHVVADGSTAVFGHSLNDSNYSGYFGGNRGVSIFGAGQAGGHLNLRGAATLEPMTDYYGLIDFIDLYSNTRGSIIARPSVFGDVLQLGAGSNTQMYICQDNRTGIGKAIPGAPLHVTNQDISLSLFHYDQDDLILEDTDALLGLYSRNGATEGSAIALGEIADGALTNKWGIYRTSTASAGHLRFSYGADKDVTVNPTYLTLTPNGKIGIGTDDPMARLSVHDSDTISFYAINTGLGPCAMFQMENSSGDNAVSVYSNSETTAAVRINNTSGGGALHVTGTTSVDVLEIRGADIAEKFPLTDNTEPGMVVAIDPEHPGQLCLSRGAYNRCVAGVISGAGDIPTGAVLGNLEDSDGDLPVALNGRVWVYCVASEHPIEPGDLLTTAEHPGYAMTVTDYQRAQGAIIGKAMTRLNRGQTGLVLVLVTLQ